MPTSGNVLALLPVLTPYTATSAQFDLLYPYALDEFEGDDPGCSKTGAERALAYLMAHYLAGGEDQIRVQRREDRRLQLYRRRAGNDLVPLVRPVPAATRPVPRRTRHRPGSARRRPARGRLRAF